MMPCSGPPLGIARVEFGESSPGLGALRERTLAEARIRRQREAAAARPFLPCSMPPETWG
jgi:hypothetical protein